MKKRLLSLALAAALTLSGLALSSCGKEELPEKSRPDHVYKSTDIALPENYQPGQMIPTGNGVLVVCTKREAVEPYTVHRMLVSVNLDDGSMTTQPITLSNEDANLNKASLRPDGSLLILEYSYDRENGQSKYALAELNDGVSSILVEDVRTLFATETAEDSSGFDRFYVDQMAIDGEGNLYLCADYAIVVLDSNFKKLFELEISGWVDSMDATSDGRVYVSFYDRQNGGQVFRFIDPAKRDFGEDVPMPSTLNVNNADFFIAPGYDIYIDNGNSLYGYDADSETGEPVELLNWVNSDIIRIGLNYVTVIDAETVVASFYDYEDDYRTGAGGLHLLKKVPEEEIPEKYIIEFAVQNAEYDLPGQIVTFNRNNDEYRIVMTDYADYRTDEDYQRGETVLQEKILAGDVPDLIQLSAFNNRETYLDSNMFADLYDLMEKDESFNKDDYFACIFEPFEKKGGLHEFVSRMRVQTMTIKADNYDGTSWTLDEFLDFAESLPEGVYLTDNTSPSGMLTTLLRGSMSSFVNTDKGSCSFDSDSFKHLLEFAKNIGTFNYRESLTGDDLSDYNQDRNKVYRENKIMMKTTTVTSIWNYLSAHFSFGFEDMTCVGYPSAEGSINIVSPIASYAIDKNSKVKEGAWEFIKYMSAPNEDGVISSFGSSDYFASNKALFEDENDLDNQMHYFFQYDGSASGWSGDSESAREQYDDQTGLFRDVEQSDIDAVKALFENAIAEPYYYQNVLDIINEEIEMYFSGDKSLDETAAIIQSRVSRYIAENS
ncbi:MAG: extracellular solute-binding protein [Clostridia bacterium]|nr:extracellular solute-binding protein [Clostridia bacterium]